MVWVKLGVPFSVLTTTILLVVSGAWAAALANVLSLSWRRSGVLPSFSHHLVPRAVRTNAVKDASGNWTLNGSKTFITNGYHSDVVIVVAKTAPEKGAHGISLFLVEQGMPGFNKGRKLKKMGLKAQDTSELFFEDVKLPGSALLGKENNGFYYLMNELPQERLLIAVRAPVCTIYWAVVCCVGLVERPCLHV